MNKMGKFLFWAIILFSAWQIFIGGPFQGYNARKNETDTKAHLYQFHQKCKAYWEKEGEDKECNASKASHYGFQTKKGINIEGGGPLAAFTATAKHEDSDKVFIKDEAGEITERK